jgi:single-strand DNA-binding protein
MRSLNRVQLIGNLTRDPEMGKTETKISVCNFSVATDRSWTTESGEKKEETEFHRVIAWQKLADICVELLSKGSKVYVDGRLSTRKFTGKDGIERITTEVIANDVIILSPKKLEDIKVEETE